jgi:hypothetical protein
MPLQEDRKGVTQQMSCSIIRRNQNDFDMFENPHKETLKAFQSFLIQGKENLYLK